MSSRLGSALQVALRIFRSFGLSGPSPTMKNHSVFEVFHKVHLKSHFLTCNFLMCLLHFGSRSVISSWVYCIFAFCFSWGAQMASKSDFQRFWWPFGSLLGPLGLFLAAASDILGASCAPLGAPGGHHGALWVSLLTFWRSLGPSCETFRGF